MNIIIKPVVTEKMNAVGEKLNRYGFMVQRDANKLQIKKAVEEIYGVKVESVNTMNYSGKRTTRYSKTGFQTGNKSAYKKALVTLESGEKIDFYSNI
jgi:large subunit ribosomal protein L23